MVKDCDPACTDIHENISIEAGLGLSKDRVQLHELQIFF